MRKVTEKCAPRSPSSRIEFALGGGGVFIYEKTPRRGALPPTKKKFESPSTFEIFFLKRRVRDQKGGPTLCSGTDRRGRFSHGFWDPKRGFHTGKGPTTVFRPQGMFFSRVFCKFGLMS